MRYLTRPNLPETSVKLCAITAYEPALQHVLSQIGIESLLVGPCSTLHKPVASHPDLLLHHLGGERVLLAQSGICNEEKLHSYGFVVEAIQGSLGPEYPNDILLNTLQLGSNAFGKRSHTEPKLLHHLERTNVRFLDIRQGYARCGTCVISEHAIATADPHIQAAAKLVGVDCLCIPPGEILLKGYTYGFLGGCCGLIAPNALAVYGNVKLLSYEAELSLFAANYGVELVSLRSDIPPTDVGTIVPLLCE